MLEGALLIGAGIVGVYLLLQAQAAQAGPPPPDPSDPLAPPIDQGDLSVDAPTVSTDPAVPWLPGDEHSFDNQFLYAAGVALQDPSQSGAGTWRLALFCKILTWREQGSSWSWNCLAHNLNMPVEDSRGLMQVNIVAHPEFAAVNLFDCNQGILAGVAIAADGWLRSGGDARRAANIYNSGSPYSGYGADVARQFEALVPALGRGPV